MSPTEVFRPGDRVLVNGREAAFLYAQQNTGVVRYDGERRSRVVALSKIRPLPERERG